MFGELPESRRDMSRQSNAHRDEQLHWFGLPVRTFDGTIEEISKHIPSFARRPFAALGDNATATGLSPYYDVIVRLPTTEHPYEFPVGIVSKSYQLVQHREVLDVSCAALVAEKIDPSAIHAEMTSTENGERARFSLEFPKEKKYSFHLDSSDEMRLRLECFNSVDGSMRFMAVLGWLRFVCANGLVIGATLAAMREMHTQQLAVDDIGILVNEGLQACRKDRKTCERWLQAKVNNMSLARWADGSLKEAWGLKAATRVLHIARTGRDAIIKGDLKNALPSDIHVGSGNRVPGAMAPVDNAFGASQALSWIAGQRRDLAEEVKWRDSIPNLIKKLIASR